MTTAHDRADDGARDGARDERGTNTVEFAIVFSFIILPVIFGIIQYGYQYWSLQTADAAAREAARSLSVGAPFTCTQTLAVERLDQPSVGTAAPVVSMSYSRGGTVVTTPQINDIVSVRVQFDSLFIGFLPLPDEGHIDRTAQARVENVPAPNRVPPCPT